MRHNDPWSAERLALRREVMRQWISNHYEHCCEDIPCRNKDGCQWPLPAVLLMMAPEEVAQLLADVDGGSC